MQLFYKFSGVLISIIFIIIGVEGKLPKIHTPLGVIQGYHKTANNGKVFSAFEGVPYAKPPFGKYRFEEPQPLTPWKGIWTANQTVKCLQYSHFEHKTLGQEDCLYLNIYTPKRTDKGSLLDVIVHIHGGAFMFGGGYVWRPNILLENNVIYINFNYRVGPLGFLSTEDGVCPGNNGLKDQVMALKWIKENILFFGGNPKSITLTGLSAGGASVTYHYISPMSQGLFQRGFALSGSALNPWAFSEKNLEKTKTLARSVGCNQDSTESIMKCLKTRPAHHIVENVKLFLGYLYNPFSPFGPVVEKGASNPFLAESPYELMKNGKVQDLPIIFSVVQAEGLYPGAEFVSDSKYLPEIDDKWDELAPHILDYNNTVADDVRSEVAKKIKKYYLDDKPFSNETYIQFIQMITDRLFVETVEDTVKLFTKAIKSPVYFHYFAYRGDFSFSSRLAKTEDNLGVSHADDSMYILEFSPPPYTNDDFLKMKEISTKLWLTFARNGVPRISGVDYKPVVIENGKFNYLEIQHPNNISMKTTHSLSSFNFWDSLPFMENKNYVP